LEVRAIFRERNSNAGIGQPANNPVSFTFNGTPAGAFIPTGGGGCGPGSQQNVVIYTGTQDKCFDRSTTFMIDVLRPNIPFGGMECPAANQNVTFIFNFSNTTAQAAPAITGVQPSYSVNVNGDCEYPITDLKNLILADVTDGCSSGIAITIDNVDGAAPAGPLTSTCTAGVITPVMVDYTVKDDCGNVTSGSTMIEVIDNSDPLITDSSNGTTNRIPVYMDADCVLDSADIMDQVFAAIDPGTGMKYIDITDNCSIADTLAINFADAFPFSLSDNCANQNSGFTLTVVDSCGNISAAERVHIIYIDSLIPTLTIPATLTIDMPTACPDFFGAEVFNALASDAGFVTSDNCEVTDTIISYNGNDFPGGGFTLPITCPGTTYRVEVRIQDCGMNIVKDSVDVIATDKSLPVVSIPSNVTLGINSGCSLTAQQVANRLFNRAIISDLCTPSNELTKSIAEAGPFFANCGEVPEPVTFTVTDTCNNTSIAQVVNITIRENFPGPTMDLISSTTSTSQAVMLMLNPTFPVSPYPNGPFPLDPQLANAQTIPDHLYGNSDGIISNPSQWWCVAAPMDTIASFNFDASTYMCNTLPSFELSLDATCVLTDADIISQITNDPGFRLSDGCTDSLTLLSSLQVIIRENDLRFDLDGTNTVTVTNGAYDVSCGDRFGVILEATDACGNVKLIGINAIVVENVAPVVTPPANNTLTLFHDPSINANCRLSPNELEQALIDAGLIVTGSCDPGALSLGLWLDNPDTAVDENGQEEDEYGGPIDNVRFKPQCMSAASPTTLYVNATNDCKGTGGFVSAAVAIDITYIDTISPVITAGTELMNNKDTITRVDGTGADLIDCQFNVNLTNKLIIDYVCNADTLTFSSPSINIFDNAAGDDVGTFPVGDHTVTATATDACGNFSDTTFTIVILDSTRPKISCAKLLGSVQSATIGNNSLQTSTTLAWNKRINTDPGVCVAELEFTLPTNIGDGCGVASVDISYFDDSVTPSVLIGNDPTGGLAGGTVHSFFFPGTNLAGNPNADTRVVVTVTDVNGNSKACIFVVRVRDREKPDAQCTNVTVAVDSFGLATVMPAALINAGTSDNCDSLTITAGTTIFDCSDVGQTNVTTFQVSDLANNTNTCQSSVTVVDTIAPTLTFANNDPNGSSVFLNCGDPYTEIFPNLVDNCPVQGSISISGNVNVNVPGTYIISYNATDGSGNPAVTLVRVVVVGNGLSGASLTIAGPSNVCANTTQLYSYTGSVPAGASINWSYTGSGGIVNSQSPGQATFSFTSGATSGDVVVTVSSGCDFADFSYPVTIDGAIAVCQSFTATVDPAVGFIQVLASDIDGGSSSACGGLSLSTIPDPAIYSCSDIGMNTLTLEATDGSGSRSTCTATVTVVELGAAPSTITGDVMVCAGQDGFNYTLSPAPSGPVTWSHSLNNAVFINQGSASVTVNYQDELSLADGYCVVDANGDPAGVISASYVPAGSCGSPITTTFSVSYMDDEICNIYNCFIDLHVNTGLSASNSPNLYTAEKRLSSDGLVVTGRDIEYTAGECVELKPGFEVELNAKFLGHIVPCVSQAFTAQEADVLIDALEKDGIKLDRELLNIENDEK